MKKNIYIQGVLMKPYGDWKKLKNSMIMKGFWEDKKNIQEFIQTHYYRSIKVVMKYAFIKSLMVLVKERFLKALKPFLVSIIYENAIRTTISLGGDADTMGAIKGQLRVHILGFSKNLCRKFL
jgi:ADP-ribosylglycohydrolase